MFENVLWNIKYRRGVSKINHPKFVIYFNTISMLYRSCSAEMNRFTADTATLSNTFIGYFKLWESWHDTLIAPRDVVLKQLISSQNFLHLSLEEQLPKCYSGLVSAQAWPPLPCLILTLYASDQTSVSVPSVTFLLNVCTATSQVLSALVKSMWDQGR